MDAEQKQKIMQLEEEIKKLKTEKETLQKSEEDKQKTIEKMDTDTKDAAGALLKLEEARIVLNRLIGPGGALTPAEREKYLKNAQGAGLPEAQVGGGGAPLVAVGATAPSNKAL